ncbi:MAG: diaminopimelate epimerase [Rhodospirillaceae bacterium]|nr:diaminopimelate epimerase [Rhodospirillaceae bacterium]
MPFRKMHGIGNDFVVLDTRGQPLDLTTRAARTLADRRWGVGCDEILIIERPKNGGDAFMGVRNADGSIAEQCGNGVRCVADVLMNEMGKSRLTIETLGGPVTATRASNGHIAIDMGLAKTEWRDIPLSEARDTLHLNISEGPLKDPVGVSMGNPHAVFFVPDALAIDLKTLGPKLEHHALFPHRANIEIVQVLSPTHLRMRVWERGSGITQACGTGACASLVAAVRRNLSARKATLTLDGGDLDIEWREDGHVIMTGPVAYSFDGVWHLSEANPP